MDPFGAEATAALPRTTTPLRMVPSLSAMMRSNHSASKCVQFLLHFFFLSAFQIFVSNLTEFFAVRQR
jgi:hypothetical protein